MAACGVVPPGVGAFAWQLSRGQDYRNRVIIVVFLLLIEGRQRIRHRGVVRVEILLRCIILVMILLLFTMPGRDHLMTAPCYETALTAEQRLIIQHMVRSEITVLEHLRV